MLLTMYIWYGTWIAVLFIACGALILYYDVSDYRNRKMKRELIASRMLAWLNITLGVVIYIGKWFLTTWIV